ncbi:hypothetical protein SCB49_10912 [unidentified eubacterium SCB49]|nr:hypothetical protein SCB49_10912 [unidentified eubacterium SCB49]
MKIVIQLVLWALIAFLGFQLWTSISEPEVFNNTKVERYQKVINNLKDIRTSQLAHQEITGTFAGTYDSLVRFIDTAQFAVTTRRDTALADEQKNRAYGLDAKTGGYFKFITIVDTLRFVSVKDSLFKDGRYKTMMNVPIEGIDKKITMQAGKLEDDKGTKYAVFEAKVSKKDILEDLDKPDLLAQELQVVSVEGIKGTEIKVGSMTDVNTSGNWPKLYDSAKNKQ